LPSPMKMVRVGRLIKQHFPRSIPITERKSKWCVVYNKHAKRWETAHQCLSWEVDMCFNVCHTKKNL
jgi:hypothetical protein